MDRRCKIIYFLDSPFYIGGSNKVLLNQAYIMKLRGYQVKVVIPNDGNGMHTEEYDRICGSYMLESLTAHYVISTCMEEIDILTAIGQYKEILCILDKERPDLIHSTQLNIATELAARELKIPHLMNIYQADRQAFGINWLDVYPQYHCADSIMMSRRWGEGLGIPSRCIRVAYEPGKMKAYHINKESTQICILSIGILCERKNQLECLKFILHCKEHGNDFVKLFLLGYNQNAYGTLCREYVEENGLQEQVEFVGFVSNVEEYFEKADLFMLTSTVESYPGVIVESMANRVPVISTPVAGVPELLKNEENGFLTDGYGAEGLVKAFSKFVEYRDSGRLGQIIEKAFHTYSENHTYRCVGNDLEQYYQWIIEDYMNKRRIGFDAAKVNEMMRAFVCENDLSVERVNSNKIWFLYHIYPVIARKKNKKAVIWGAGFWGGTALGWIALLKDKVEFVGFIDTLKRGTYLGFPIMNDIDDMIDTCGTIMIAMENEKSRLEIMDYLDGRGKERNRDYFLTCNAPIRL